MLSALLLSAVQAKTVVVELRVQATRLQAFANMNEGAVLAPPSTTGWMSRTMTTRTRDTS